jgi:uncharacterized protein (UPF0262 family)
MHRYFFDTEIGDLSVTDSQGIEARDLDHARDLAVDALPEMLREAVRHGQSGPVRVKVRDAEGQCRFRAALVFETETL